MYSHCTVLQITECLLVLSVAYHNAVVYINILVSLTIWMEYWVNLCNGLTYMCFWLGVCRQIKFSSKFSSITEVHRSTLVQYLLVSVYLHLIYNHKSEHFLMTLSPALGKCWFRGLIHDHICVIYTVVFISLGSLERFCAPRIESQLCYPSAGRPLNGTIGQCL